jgi:hypothetical protein
MPARDEERLSILRSIFGDTTHKCISKAEDIFSASWASVIDIQDTNLIAIAAKS